MRRTSEAKALELINSHPRFNHIDDDRNIYNYNRPTYTDDYTILKFSAFAAYNSLKGFKEFPFSIIELEPLCFMHKKEGKFIKDNLVKIRQKPAIDKILEEKFRNVSPDKQSPKEIRDIIYEYMEGKASSENRFSPVRR